MGKRSGVKHGKKKAFSGVISKLNYMGDSYMKACTHTYVMFNTPPNIEIDFRYEKQNPNSSFHNGHIQNPTIYKDCK